MARATKRKSKKGKAKASPFATGLSDKELMSNMASGGNRDPELVMLGDGDEMEVAIVSPKSDWTTFGQHYVDNEYKICGGDGCEHCDDGSRPSRRALIGVYVHKRFRPERKDYKAVRTKDEGHRYFVLNTRVVETLLKISNRRGGKLDDRMYLFQRDGDGFDTKYHVERLDGRPTRKMLNWSKMDTHDKVMRMFNSEQEASDDDKPKRGKRRRSDDFDYDDDLEKFDEKPRRRKGGKRRRR